MKALIPNILTTFRLILIPIFSYFILWDKNIWVASSIFLLSGLIDILDGYIARRFNMITDVGKVYDPLVDKLMQITAIVSLWVANIVPLWAIWFIITKEIVMIIVGTVLYTKKIVVQSNWYGKAATVLFYTIIFIFIVGINLSDSVKNSLLGILIIVMIAVAICYGVNLIRTWKR